MNRMTRAILAIFFIAVIAVSVISLCHGFFKSTRLDMTEHKLYTLSDGTKTILANLKQPITMKLFYTKTATMQASDQIRYYNNYYTYVKALLEEYEKQAKGKVILEVVDPRPYSEEELAAIRYGLKRFPISEDENFIFGLVTQTQFGATKTIEFFATDRQQLVEYDISYLIDTAITRQKKRVGVLSSLDLIGETGYMAQMKQMQGQKPKPKWGIISHLEKQYEVTAIPADTGEIKDVDFLLVIHPKDFQEKTLFAIDQFILKGGRAIIAVDPHCVADRPDMQQRFGGQQHSTRSDLAKLLSNWGLILPANTFAGDTLLSVMGSTRPGQRPEKILGVLKLEAAYNCFNVEKPITSQLNEVTMVFPGVLKVRQETSENEETADLTYTPLLSTSSKGNTWKVDNALELMNPDYAKFMRRFRDGDKPVSMAYLLTGTFKSAYPDGIEVPVDSPDENTEEDGANQAQDSETQKLRGLTEALEPGAVVVLADVDMLSDLVAYRRTFFGVEPVGDNSTFVLNTLEDLAGSPELISIRSRGNYKRPFIVVDEIEKQADDETKEEETKIMAQIKGFEQQLNEKIRAVEGENKGELISQTIIEEKKKIELELREAEKQLRDIKMQKRKRVEKLKTQLRSFCTLPGPALTLVIAVILGIYRSTKRRLYISHASDS